MSRHLHRNKNKMAPYLLTSNQAGRARVRGTIRSRLLQSWYNIRHLTKCVTPAYRTICKHPYNRAEQNRTDCLHSGSLARTELYYARSFHGNRRTDERTLQSTTIRDTRSHLPRTSPRRCDMRQNSHKLPTRQTSCDMHRHVAVDF